MSRLLGIFRVTSSTGNSRLFETAFRSITKARHGNHTAGLITSRSLVSISAASTLRAEEHDRLLVVGSGVAGSTAALIAAETYQMPVTMLFAGNVPTDCNSYWAQGGIIYKGHPDIDSPESLAKDIHRAGAGLCYDPAVMKVSTEGPERVRQLLLNDKLFAKVPFDVDEATGELALCLEASHSAPRILHKADHTGRTITEHITAAAANHPLIHLQASTIVTDLIVADGLAVGVKALQMDKNGILMPTTEYATRGIVLASGGLGGIYEHSTNPTGFNALGSSVALATRAGVLTQDLEFVQFHPTALCLPGQARFLLSEALRGEGAILRDASGRAFAKDYHPDGELAPRDVVARAVFTESLKSSSSDQHNVFLDITHRDADWLHHRFPSICEHLRLNNLDLATDQLPITPAAHYTCGGISTDLHGSTSLSGCYAAGEAARTGLHGGNRLASTSLLEGLVFGASVADHAATADIRTVEATQVIQTLHRTSSTSIPSSTPSMTNNSSNATAKDLLQKLRRVMWDYVGVTRSASVLQRKALPLLKELAQQAESIHATAPTFETAAVRDATCAGHAVAQAALANTRSIGAHCLVSDQNEEYEEVETEGQMAAN